MACHRERRADGRTDQQYKRQKVLLILLGLGIMIGAAVAIAIAVGESAQSWHPLRDRALRPR